jgi:PPK2 family polyphosphate:nucleotide phosphotransferase
MTDDKQNAGVAVVVRSGGKFRLADVDPRIKPAVGKDNAKERTSKDAGAIDELQNRLYAEGKRALLVILQGTDSSGKDGTIRVVFNVAGPIGVRVTAFRAPNSEEAVHDFLWRVHKAVPPKGLIGIFNRSHYEDVLIARVKRLAPATVIEKRYEQINHFEKHLAENGTTVLKFMLHVSKEEQRKRFAERLTDPKKRWKYNPADLGDRKLWDDYQAAYETMLNRCSTDWAPWHVIPADRNWVRNWTVAQIVRSTLEGMNPQYPKPQWNAAEMRID